MENNLKLSKKEKKTYINLITQRFLTNPRMIFLFEKKSPEKYYFKVKKLVEYCFCIALKLNGCYISKNKKTLVLFYEKKKFKQNKYDYYRYLKVLLNIRIKKIFEVLKNEKLIKQKRLNIDNYIYVWFIAQEKNYRKLDGLIEINNLINQISNQKKIPILLETSNKAVLNLYRRAGFEIYTTLKTNRDEIYFFIDKANLTRTEKITD